MTSMYDINECATYMNALVLLYDYILQNIFKSKNAVKCGLRTFSPEENMSEYDLLHSYSPSQ